jgi:hypothetical protein
MKSPSKKADLHQDAVPAEYAEVDFAALIQQLGGPSEVSKGLGFPDVSSRRVYTWTLRRSVPGRYVLPLIALAKVRRIANSIEDLPRLDPFSPI